jgi:hypothetical protein
MNAKAKKKLNKFHPNTDSIPFLIGVVLVFFIASIGVDFLYGTHAAASTNLAVTPSSASVVDGNNVTFSVTLTPSGSSINTVQSVLTYNPANFSLVSAAAGSAFNTSTTPVETPGSVGFTVTNTGAPITTNVTVETITLKANATGTSGLNLAAVCPAGNYAATCSAAYDSVTNDNDLGGVSNASYTITTPVAATTPTNPTPTNNNPTNTTSTSTPTKSTSTSSSSKMSGSDDTSMMTGSSSTDGSTTAPSGSDTAMGSGTTTSKSTSGKKYAITIDVVNSKQQPVKGAKVTINGQTVTTNGAGVASVSTPSGTYTYKVSGSGIQPYSNSINVLPTNNQQFEAEVKTTKSSSAAALILIIILLFVLLIVIYIWIRRRGGSNPPDDYSSDDTSSDPYSTTPSDSGSPPNIISPSSRFAPGQERSAPGLEHITSASPPQSAPLYGGQIVNPTPQPRPATQNNVKPPTTLVVPH